ncbi:hypothetical protein NE237_020188 [Protea cynaroides]|uniref:Uncharacterized protein n=1 Tax=Protea cynaroides TaxID=273540 RepID=A0A9Q0H8L5_9MAGN|nr:hypothetical protein NE237_020188 [Protea cynaroides]
MVQGPGSRMIRFWINEKGTRDELTILDGLQISLLGSLNDKEENAWRFEGSEGDSKRNTPRELQPNQFFWSFFCKIFCNFRSFYTPTELHEFVQYPFLSLLLFPPFAASVLQQPNPQISL